MSSGNLFENLPEPGGSAEDFLTLARADGFKIERIVSQGHCTPPGEWYDQATTEYVTVLRGEAGLLFDGEGAPRVMKQGDWVLIPAHRRHRVEWTSKEEHTIWLAVHIM
jgi:cupin 2 domain-containing protein